MQTGWKHTLSVLHMIWHMKLLQTVCLCQSAGVKLLALLQLLSSLCDWADGSAAQYTVSAARLSDGTMIGRARVCSEWAICGSWCRAAFQTMWQSSGISLSMAHADSAAGLLWYTTWLPSQASEPDVCLTRPCVSPPARPPARLYLCTSEKFRGGGKGETNASRSNTASGLVIGRTHHD